MTVLERGSGTLRRIIKLLRGGNVLAILPDVRVYTPDLQPFLGSTANVGRGMAIFCDHRARTDHSGDPAA